MLQQVKKILKDLRLYPICTAALQKKISFIDSVC